MNPPSHHPCGKHVVNVNADTSSPIPVWTACEVHRSGPDTVRHHFDAITRLEFSFEEALRLSCIVAHGMLD